MLCKDPDKGPDVDIILWYKASDSKKAQCLTKLKVFKEVNLKLIIL